MRPPARRRRELLNHADPNKANARRSNDQEFAYEYAMKPIKKGEEVGALMAQALLSTAHWDAGRGRRQGAGGAPLGALTGRNGMWAQHCSARWQVLQGGGAKQQGAEHCSALAAPAACRSRTPTTPA